MKIGITIALNGRTAIAERVLAHYAWLALKNVVLHAVGSHHEDLTMADAAGWAYDHADNGNLAAKRNAGLAALRAAGCGAVIRIGADDILSVPLLSRMVEALRSGARGVIVRGSFVQDGEAGEVIELYRADYALGIGAPVLEAYGWELYQASATSAPDMMISAYVSGPDVVRIASTPDAPFVQIKSEGSLNTFARIKAREIWRPAPAINIAELLVPLPETEPAPAPRKRNRKPAATETNADDGDNE